MLFQNKKGIILGVATTSSIAYSIAKLLREHGADLILTYPNDSIKRRLDPIAQELGAVDTFQCNVSEPEAIANLAASVQNKGHKLDFLVHSIAFSNKDELKGRFVDTSLENFLNTMNVSCYSFISLCKHFEKLLNPGSSVLTLSYYGAVKVIPNYNVMGVAKAGLESSVRYLSNDLGPNIRVNAISAGPIRTPAASAIGDFGKMLQSHKSTAPLQRNVSPEEVAKSSLYLLSDLASGVTSEVHYVDGGFSSVGLSSRQPGEEQIHDKI